MSTSDLESLVGAVVAYTAVCGWLFRVQFVATNARDGVARIDADRVRDKADFTRRLEKAEEVAADLKALAESVKGLTELMEQEARHQADRYRDLKDEIHRARDNAAQAKELASRRRGMLGED